MRRVLICMAWWSSTPGDMSEIICVWENLQLSVYNIEHSYLRPMRMPQNRQWTKDGNLSKLVPRIVVKHLVNDSFRCGLGNHPAGIEGVCKERTRHVVCSRAPNEEIVDDNPLKGCGRTPDVRTVWVAHWHEK